MNDYSHSQDSAPKLMMQSSVISYDTNDVDGRLAMLDMDFACCVTLAFSKAMDPSSRGITVVAGKQVSWCLKQVAIARNVWLLGVKIAGIVDEYDTEYTLHIEGFCDTDGNAMVPVDVPIKTLARAIPLPAYAAHEAIALQAAEEGMVLLKNDGDTLPLMPGVLNVFGNGFHIYRSGVVGAGQIYPRYTVSLKEAIRESRDFSLNQELADFYKGNQAPVPDMQMMDKARSLSDTALIVLTRFSGENTDSSTNKGEYYLSDEEEAMIATVTAQFAHTVVILNVPYPMDVRFAQKYKVDALLYAGLGGMLGGQAVLNVLSGRVNPSGKLTDTWSLDYDDIPASKNFYDSAKGNGFLDTDANVWVDTVYEEDIYVGYRYFDTFGVEVAYPFGYGLSYTSFDISDVQVNYTRDEVQCSVAVRNTGKRAGKEVVQLYVSKPDGKLEQPAKELVAFEKTRLLQPGEAQEITLCATNRQMASYDEDRAAYMMEAGRYGVSICNSVITAQEHGAFVLGANKIIRQVSRRMTPVTEIKTLSKKDAKATFPQGKHSGIKSGATAVEPKRVNHVHKPTIAFAAPDKPISFAEVIQTPEKAASFVAQLSAQELCRLTVCSSAGWGMEGVGVAGRLAALDGHPLAGFLVADGNSSVKVTTANIGLPTSVLFCSTFNKELVMEIGRVLGEEGRQLGVTLMLVPGMNIHRNPLNGRHAEYFSEDPYLAGMMAGFYCKGLESTGMGGCYKHFIANNCESARKRNQSIMTERALRDIYFRAFEIALTVHESASIMTAYNAVNGVHAAADTELIRGLLREETGFDGFVMTDWNTYESCDIVDMILGGNNWLTPGSTDDKFTAPLQAAVDDGRLPLDVLQESVMHLLKAIARLAR